MNNQVVNPFLTSWEYIPDGEPRVFGDRLYLYGTGKLVIPAGTAPLYFVFEGGGSLEFTAFEIE